MIFCPVCGFADKPGNNKEPGFFLNKGKKAACRDIFFRAGEGAYRSCKNSGTNPEWWVFVWWWRVGGVSKENNQTQWPKGDTQRSTLECVPGCVRALGSKFINGRGDVLQGGSSLRGGESLDGLQSPVAMVTAQVNRRAHAFLRLNCCQELRKEGKRALVCHVCVSAATVQLSMYQKKFVCS